MPHARRVTLSSRLDAYSATLRSSRVDETRRRRSTNWQIYAAVTGSALAMATNASAGLIVHPNPSPTSPTLGSVTGNLGYPGNPGGWIPAHGTEGVTSFLPNAAGFQGNVFQTSANGARRGRASIFAALVSGFEFFMTTKDVFLRNLSSAAQKQISAGSFNGGAGKVAKQGLLATQFVAGSLGAGHGVSYVAACQFGALKSGLCPPSASATGNRPAPFQPGKPGYAGFSFSYNGHTDYGWIELEFTEGTNGLANSFSLPEAAFYDASAPEPSTGALAILAAGALGVTALRRRKKAA